MDRRRFIGTAVAALAGACVVPVARGGITLPAHLVEPFEAAAASGETIVEACEVPKVGLLQMLINGEWVDVWRDGEYLHPWKDSKECFEAGTAFCFWGNFPGFSPFSLSADGFDV